MSVFSVERLKQWHNLLGEIDGYKALRSELGREYREKVLLIQDGRTEKGKDITGMAIPIVNKKMGRQRGQ